MQRELDRYRVRAQRVKIVRDDWGIAHVRGESDADAVFGLIYAQAEDDFNRIETHYLLALGRMAETEGEQAIYQDLRVKLFVDPADLKSRYASSPTWLRTLMDAWADGLNFYLATHPHVTPRVIQHFEPWMALSFPEGGVLGDIARVPVEDLQAFYSQHELTQAVSDTTETLATATPLPESTGSNAFAIAPGRTLAGKALLLINPHPEFYFRCEAHVQSDEGLNCYGAAAWGQFFIYQGFNERLGWGHTSSGADTVDEYIETLLERDGQLFYRHGDRERPLEVSELQIPYRAGDGSLAHRRFSVYRTHHGPIVRQSQGQWISIALMYKPVDTLTQSFLRMKTRNYRDFLELSRLKANSVGNTVYADADGNIAYWPPQFMPRRNDQFDFTQPLDGANPATDWKGEHELEELPSVLNPPDGWIENTNDAPYSVAGPSSLKAEDYPRYMDTAGENPRSVNAARVLQARMDFTLTSLIEAAYDPYLSAFARLIPGLVADFDRFADSDSLKAALAEQIDALRRWDYCHSLDSVATSLAVFWGEQVMKDIERSAKMRSVEMASMFDYLHRGGVSATLTFRALDFIHDYIEKDASADLKLRALVQASDQLARDFGSWRTPWGEINRFQRLSGDIVQKFDDAQPSVPVALTSSIWGSLASFKTRRLNTKRCYGISGNGFVAAVEFGEKVRAVAIIPGGVSSDPASPHFNDQAARFSTGELREVYFYPDELQKHARRTYRPGDDQ